MKKDLKELWDGLNTAGKIVVVLGGIFAVWLTIVTLYTVITTEARQRRQLENDARMLGK